MKVDILSLPFLSQATKKVIMKVMKRMENILKLHIKKELEVRPGE